MRPSRACTPSPSATLILRRRYTPGVDISELITLEDAMDAFKLGPNGGAATQPPASATAPTHPPPTPAARLAAMMYCLEFLEQNIDWLKNRLDAVKGPLSSQLVTTER